MELIDQIGVDKIRFLPTQARERGNSGEETGDPVRDVSKSLIFVTTKKSLQSLDRTAQSTQA